jgi:hypothetical protein
MGFDNMQHKNILAVCSAETNTQKDANSRESSRHRNRNQYKIENDKHSEYYFKEK